MKKPLPVSYRFIAAGRGDRLGLGPHVFLHLVGKDLVVAVGVHQFEQLALEADPLGHLVAAQVAVGVGVQRVELPHRRFDRRA